MWATFGKTLEGIIESGGPALGLVKGFLPIEQALGMDEENEVLASYPWNSSLPASCNKTPPSGYSVCSALWIRIFIHSFTNSLTQLIKTAQSLCFVPGTVLIPVYKEGSQSVSQGCKEILLRKGQGRSNSF